VKPSSPNAGTFVTFRVNELDDAASVARHLGGELIGASDLQRLPDHEAYVRLTRAGALHEFMLAAHVHPSAAPVGAAAQEAKLIENGRHWYARPLAEVEAERQAGAITMLSNDEPEIATLSAGNAALPAYPA